MPLNLTSASILKVHTAVSIPQLESAGSESGAGAAAASDEIRRQIDQCTLIPINHGGHRGWIIISCAGRCHLWEISGNNFCSQCKGEERKLRRCMIWIIAWPRWRHLGPAVPTSLASKWIPQGSRHQYPHTILPVSWTWFIWKVPTSPIFAYQR